jgi:hypothetical protein
MLIVGVGAFVGRQEIDKRFESTDDYRDNGGLKDADDEYLNAVEYF